MGLGEPSRGPPGPLPDRGGLSLTYEEGSMASHSGQIGATCTQMSMGCGGSSSVLGLGPCPKSCVLCCPQTKNQPKTDHRRQRRAGIS